jgi:hypothetical protein
MGASSAAKAHAYTRQRLLRNRVARERSELQGATEVDLGSCHCGIHEDKRAAAELGPLFPYCGRNCWRSDENVASVSAGTSFFLRDLAMLATCAGVLVLICVPVMTNFAVLNSISATSPNGTYGVDQRLVSNPLAERLFPASRSFWQRLNMVEVSALPSFFMGRLTLTAAAGRYASDPLVMLGVVLVVIFSTAIAIGTCATVRFLSMRSDIIIENSDQAHFTPSDFTVRVRNVPSSATATELATFFGNWGVVREVQFFDSAKRWLDPKMISHHTAATKLIGIAEHLRAQDPRPNRLDDVEQSLHAHVDALRERAAHLEKTHVKGSTSATLHREGVAFVSFDVSDARERCIADNEAPWGCCVRVLLPQSCLWVEEALECVGGGPCKIDGAVWAPRDDAFRAGANANSGVASAPAGSTASSGEADGPISPEAPHSIVPTLAMVPMSWRLPRRTCCAGKCGAPQDVSPCYRVDVDAELQTNCVCYATRLPGSLVIRRAHEPGEMRWDNLMVKGVLEWWRGVVLVAVVAVYIIVLLSISTSYLLATTWLELKTNADIDLWQQVAGEIGSGGGANGTASDSASHVGGHYASGNKYYAFAFTFAISLCKTVYTQVIMKVVMKLQRRHTVTDEQETLLLLYTLQEVIYFGLYSMIAIVTTLYQYDQYSETLNDKFLFASYSVADACALRPSRAIFAPALSLTAFLFHRLPIISPSPPCIPPLQL